MKEGTILGALTACAVLAVLVLGGAGDRERAPDLVYGSWLSAHNPTLAVTMSAYSDAVDKTTDGKVKIRTLAGSQVVTGPESLDATRVGLVDAGHVIASYTPKQLPATYLIFKTLVPSANDVAISGALMETILLHCPQCIEEYKANNGVVFAGFSVQPYYLMCTTPIRTVGDVKGLKVRATGTARAIVEAVGATPVGMDVADSVTAMERGIVDCTMASYAWLINLGYIDVVSHILDRPLGASGPSIPFFLNRQAWNGMSQKNRKIMLQKAALIVAIETLDAQRGAIRKARSAVEERGLDLVEGGDDFVRIVNGFASRQRKINIQIARENGVRDPEKILAAYDAALSKWRRLSEEIGDDRDVFVNVLNREIYDKLSPDQI